MAKKHDQTVIADGFSALDDAAQLSESVRTVGDADRGRVI
jgi:hypothetical protein